jgi:archaetidylinositol phosphate synthase
MLESWCRDYYQRWCVDQLALKLAPRWSPMVITLAGVLLGLAAAITTAWHLTLLPVILLLASGYCDTLDGTLARLRKVSSPIGSVCDIVADRVVEFAMVLGLFWVDPLSRSLTSMLMLGSFLICITSFLVVGIFTENQTEKGFFYSVGLIERTEAFIFFILMIVFPDWFNVLAVLLTVLVWVSALLHLYAFYRNDKAKLC